MNGSSPVGKAHWQNRPHDGLRHPLTPGAALTPNEQYAALLEVAGYAPAPLAAEDYLELLPLTWRVINAYGIKINRRTYDCQALNPYRGQASGIAAQKGRWEVRYDPYDVTRIWVRNHHDGGRWRRANRVCVWWRGQGRGGSDAARVPDRRSHAGPADPDHAGARGGGYRRAGGSREGAAGCGAYSGRREPPAGGHVPVRCRLRRPGPAVCARRLRHRPSPPGGRPCPQPLP